MKTLYIKNMVCNRCISAVEQIFTVLQLPAQYIILGEVRLQSTSISNDILAQLDKALVEQGFERIDDKRTRLIESMKKIIIDQIHGSQQLELKYNWSKVMADGLHHEYGYLSSLFSTVEGITLEQYIIRQKIERVKELMFYDELNLSQIADRMGYSSVAHLSAQFKKVTGFTPTELKKLKSSQGWRKSIDSLTI